MIDISALAAIIAAGISVCGSIWNAHVNRQIAKESVAEQKAYMRQTLILKQQTKFAEIEFTAIAETLEKLIDYSDNIGAFQGFIKDYEVRKESRVKHYIISMQKSHADFINKFNKKMFYMSEKTAESIGYCALPLEEAGNILTLGICILNENSAEHIGFKKGFVRVVEPTTTQELVKDIYEEVEEALEPFTDRYNEQCKLQAARFKLLKEGLKQEVKAE